MFRLAYPAMVALLVPATVWGIYAFRRKPSALTYSLTSTLAGFAGPADRLRARLPLILRSAALVLLVVSAARPQLYNVSRDVKTPGVDIMLALDTSGSMRAVEEERR